MRDERINDILEFAVGASIVIIAFLVLLLLGYFENNMTYIAVTFVLVIIAVLASYFIGYHHKMKRDDGIIKIR
ncbi:MAG: hypothetical protein GXO64_01040 [Candidatus Micrarchaeota archaeon]|nr:hypothetical protein [Candidatus Micrarchaeota archaeon]